MTFRTHLWFKLGLPIWKWWAKQQTSSEVQRSLAWMSLDWKCKHDRDMCEVCQGFQGGVLGNENIVDGVTMCDYCHNTYRTAKLLVQNRNTPE